MDCTRMPFGKHRGRPLSEIPADYLRWVLDNCDNITPRLRAEITRLLNPAAEPPAGSLTTSVCNQWYRTMAVRFHPDKGGSHEAMKAVNAGRELLLQLAGGDAA